MTPTDTRPTPRNYPDDICAYEAYFDHIDAWIYRALELRSSTHRNGHTNAEETARSGPWTGYTSYQEALEMMEYGWPEGRDQLAKGLEQVKLNNWTRLNIPARSFDVAGSTPDVPLALSGELSCMFSVGETDRATRPVIRFYLEGAGSASNEGHRFTNQGLGLLAYVDALENLDIRCEIVVRWGSAVVTGARRGCVIDVTVKRATDPVNLEQLAFFLGHPAAFRRIVFAFRNRTPGFSEFFPGYGHPQIAALRELPEIGILIPSVNEGGNHWDTPHDAVKYVRKIIVSALTARPDMRWHLLEVLFGLDLSDDLVDPDA